MAKGKDKGVANLGRDRLFVASITGRGFFGRAPSSTQDFIREAVRSGGAQEIVDVALKQADEAVGRLLLEALSEYAAFHVIERARVRSRRDGRNKGKEPS